MRPPKRAHGTRARGQLVQKILVFFCAALVAAAPAPTRAPVLVELFTSEGCSSCPPADRLLAQLDASAIVLSEHVDYWDHQGWKDRFSSHAFTERQESYGRRFHLDGVYTPEMVVDGAAEFNGSDARRAAEEIAAAGRKPKAEIRLARTAAGIDVNLSGAPRSASVFLALATGSETSQVSAGENKGRTMQHVAVMRSLRKIGSVKRGAPFHEVIAAPAGQRVIVFLQEGDTGAICGAAMFEAGN